MTQTTRAIEDLEGRDLDAAVAQKVMGWKSFDGPPEDVKDDWLPQYPDEWYRKPAGGWENASNVPAYSSDIAAAWIVVEEIEEKSIEKLGRFLGRADTGRPWYRLSSEQMAERICRAALRAASEE